jgi:protein SCO1/2
MSQHMSELQTSLGGMPGVRLVTFTVDPDYDTPQVLAAYATRYNADAQRWLFLTGDQSRIRDLSIHGFKLGVADNPSETREPGQDAILHSTSFVLVDAAGRIRGYYNGDDAAARHKLRVDIHRLLRERAS